MHVQGRTAATLAVAVVVIAALWVAIMAGPANASDARAAAVSGELIVGFEDGVSGSESRQIISAAGGDFEQALPSLDGVVIDASSPVATERALERIDGVAFVEPNYLLKAERTPNDDSFAEQWGMRNTGQLGGKSGADIGATSAWDVITGGGITVAVIDTGVDYRHPDLDSNMWRNPAEQPNGVDDDGNGFVDDLAGADFANGDGQPNDDAGHGTHVAGVIGAEGNNGIGIAGINWQSRLMALKFLDGNGEGNTADAAMAIDYAVRNGARVINASWGGPAFSQTLYEAVRRAGDKGVVFVAAAGNEGNNSDVSPDYPAAFDLPNIVSVAASDRYDRLLGYSNFGRQSVDLAAPGDDIYSTVPNAVDPSGYASFSGTSMAAPSVAGAIALYLSHAPGASGDQARSAVLSSADQSASFAGRVATGGRLNVSRTLGVQPAAEPARDSTPPSAFVLKSPRNHYATAKRGVLFKWQKAKDASGIRYYKLYVDGRKLKTIKDTDGPGGHEPKSHTRIKLPSGRHSWYVKAYDQSGNVRRSRKSSKKATASRSLYIGKRYAAKRHR